MLIHLYMFWNHQFGVKYGPRGPPRAIYEPGGKGVAETPIVSRVLTQFHSLVFSMAGSSVVRHQSLLSHIS